MDGADATRTAGATLLLLPSCWRNLPYNCARTIDAPAYSLHPARDRIVGRWCRIDALRLSTELTAQLHAYGIDISILGGSLQYRALT